MGDLTKTNELTQYHTEVFIPDYKETIDFLRNQGNDLIEGMHSQFEYILHNCQKGFRLEKFKKVIEQSGINKHMGVIVRALSTLPQIVSDEDFVIINRLNGNFNKRSVDLKRSILEPLSNSEKSEECNPYWLIHQYFDTRAALKRFESRMEIMKSFEYINSVLEIGFENFYQNALKKDKNSFYTDISGLCWAISKISMNILFLPDWFNIELVNKVSLLVNQIYEYMNSESEGFNKLVQMNITEYIEKWNSISARFIGSQARRRPSQNK